MLAAACLASFASGCSAPVAGSADAVNVLSFKSEGAASGEEGASKARVAETPKESFSVADDHGRCAKNMVEIPNAPPYCIDKYEASLVEMLPNGEERALAPFGPIAGRNVRAVSAPGVFPQGYISAVEAQRACALSGKRLCKVNEWRKACRGPDKRAFGYADRREPGRCNDRGRNPVIALFGRGRWNWSTMNQPELNQLSSTLARTGAHEGCTNGYGVYDMVGNLHEWVADPQGTFFGGYYQDVASQGHGEGCGYQTTAHEARYHDYSTGFRCCADPNH
jgi:hypothetical protein